MCRAWRATLAVKLPDPIELARAGRGAAETFELFEAVLAPGDAPAPGEAAAVRGGGL